MSNDKLNVFVSYSHADDPKWLQRVQVHLKPLARNGRLDLWDDKRIEAGDKWRDEIKQAIENADVAVLLISADFYASDFIDEKELPKLLEAAQGDKGLVVLGVHINYSHFEDDEVLSGYQTINRPNHPLEAVENRGEQEKVFQELAHRIKKIKVGAKTTPEDFNLVQTAYENLIDFCQIGAEAFGKKLGPGSASKFIRLFKEKFAGKAGEEALEELQENPSDGDLRGQLAVQVRKSIEKDSTFASNVKNCLLNSNLKQENFSKSNPNIHMSNSGLLIGNFEANNNVMIDSGDVVHIEQNIEQDDLSITTYRKKKYDNQPIDLDNKAFYECEFTQCELIYSGGLPPTLNSCRISDCNWTLKEASLRTMAFLQNLYAHGGITRELVERALGINKK